MASAIAFTGLFILLSFLQTLPQVGGSGAPVLLAFFDATLLGTQLYLLLFGAVPPGFSRAERTKYRFAQMVRLCEKYQKVYDDPRERRAVARKCRRAADRLLRTV